MIDGDKEINLIKSTVELSGNISITSMPEVTTNNTSGEKTADRNQIIQPMEKRSTKANHDTCGKYIEKLEYLMTTFLKSQDIKTVGRVVGKTDWGRNKDNNL